MIDTILLWFKRAMPEPNDRNRTVQLGCHFEEVDEMVDALLALRDMRAADLANYYKDPQTDPARALAGINRVELLDSLCDQIVTAIGVAHTFGMDIESALKEVNSSNWSKFNDGCPVFGGNGKIIKGPKYFRPNLEPFV